MTHPVLVLGTEPRIAVTIARSLHRQGIPVDVGALSQTEPVVSSRAVRRFLRFPPLDPGSNGFLQTIRQEIRANGYDTLFPCSDTMMSACLAHYGELSQLLHVACPPPEITSQVLDKAFTLALADRLSIPIPETYPLLSAADLESQGKDLRFPLVAKPKAKFHAGMFKTRRFGTFDEIAAAYRENPQFGAQNLIQEQCIGVGLGIEILIHEGEAAAAFQHRRIKELPASGGVSVLAISERLDPGLLQYSICLLRALKWEGVAMVEFLWDPATHSAKLMEVNGRYWGSVATAVHAGVDFPYWHWLIIHGQHPDTKHAYQIGMRARWTCGDFLRLHDLWCPVPHKPPTTFSRWQELGRFLGDFRPSTREMLWSWADPVPALAEFSRELKHVVASDIRRLAGLFMPEVVKTWMKIRNRNSDAGFIFAKLKVARSFGLLRDRSRGLPSNIRTIVCVCHGNIIRSPMTEALLRRFLAPASSYTVASAGLFAKVGKSADPRALIACQDFGVSLEQHKAQPLTQSLVDQADLILVMDFENEAILLSHFPHTREKTFLLGGFSDEARLPSAAIPDPYNGDLDGVRKCYARLNAHVINLVKLIEKNR